MTKPAYRDRYPCPRCGSGYLDCAQLWTMSLKCCVECAHPGYREADPAFTVDEIADMRCRAGMAPLDQQPASRETPAVGPYSAPDGADGV